MLNNNSHLIGFVVAVSVAAYNSSCLFAAKDMAILSHESLMPEIVSGAWENPVLLSQKYDLSLSEIEGGYSFGESSRYGYFDTSTFIRTSGGAITGHASYSNGKRLDVKYCQVDDASTVYPYFTLIGTQGDMRFEKYSFGGSWSGTAGSFNIGALAAYDAGLSYRDIDPRPRNVTGRLSLSVGTAYRMDEAYLIGANIEYERYKQSSDIEFRSETGESTVYHHTGVGNVYHRFIGLGKTTSYYGNTWGGAITLFPRRAGFFVQVEGNIFRCSHILVDLNKLPMSRIDDRMIGLALGYKAETWGLTGSFSHSVRHGYENLFGDAVAGQYPMIGTLGMYRHSVSHGVVKGVKEWHTGRWIVGVLPEVGVYRSKEAYRQPSAEEIIESIRASCETKCVYTFSCGIVAIADAGIKHVFSSQICHQNIVDGRVELDFPIKTKYYIGAEAICHHDAFGNSYAISAVFKF